MESRSGEMGRRDCAHAGVTVQSSQHRRPLWLGVLAASLAPAVSIIFVGFASASRYPPLTKLLKTIGMVFALTTPVALAGILVLGLPLVLWLRSRKVLNAAYVCIGAIAIGVFAWAVVGWVITYDHRLPNSSMLLVGAVFGLISGVAFCIGSAIGFSARQEIE